MIGRGVRGCKGKGRERPFQRSDRQKLCHREEDGAEVCVPTPGLATGRRGGSEPAYRSLGMGSAPRTRYPGGMRCVVPLYRPRDAEHTVLHQVISEHLESFLHATVEAGDGVGLRHFVERELREFVLCGAFEGGVARFQCEDSGREHLVPFSCKGRG